MIELIKGFPAARINGHLTISDIHLGFEKELEQKGYTVPSQSKKMLEKIFSIKKNSKKIIILGDLKHQLIPKYSNEIKEFIKGLSENFKEVYIIKGNHNGLIEKYCQGIINAKVVNELSLGDYLLFHGHKMPKKESIRNAKTFILGHFHSGFNFKSYLGKITSVKAWNFYSFDNEKFFCEKKIKTDAKLLLSMPSFNDFFQGSQEKNGPMKNFIELKESIALGFEKIF